MVSPEEINGLVARKFGWMPDVCGPYPDYCRDIKAAWEIIDESDEVVGVIKLGDYYYALGGLDPMETRALAAPMAICLAFLKS